MTAVWGGGLGYGWCDIAGWSRSGIDTGCSRNVLIGLGLYIRRAERAQS